MVSNLILGSTGSRFPPIDAVITHVDSKDPEWQKQRQKYQPDPAKDTINSTKAWRWESNDEAKYCIRGIRRYAPWVRKIYLVVAFESQVPAWVKDENNRRGSKPNIIIIFHRDIYEYPAQDLPTFNSTSIEANLHRIPGLSEHFLYFNDDCFLGASVTPAHFLGVISTERNKVMPTGQPSSQDLGYICACKNSNAMLDRIFPEQAGKPREFIRHAPQLQRRSVHAKLKELFPREFARTTHARFRTTEIHNTVACLAEYYMIYTGMAIVDNRSPNYVQFFLGDSLDTNRRALAYLRAYRPQFMNVQNAVTVQDPRINLQLQEFLEAYYP